MPIVWVPKSGGLDTQFVTLVKKLRASRDNTGQDITRGPRSTPSATAETGDRATATVCLGIQIDDSGYVKGRSRAEAFNDTSRGDPDADYERMDFWALLESAGCRTREGSPCWRA